MDEEELDRIVLQGAFIAKSAAHPLGYLVWLASFQTPYTKKQVLECIVKWNKRGIIKYGSGSMVYCDYERLRAYGAWHLMETQTQYTADDSTDQVL